LVGGGLPVLKVPLTVSGHGPNSFSVVLPTRNGRVYRLEFANSLTNPAWGAFPLQTGVGGPTRFTDPSPTAAQRFYRVQQW
jgi:hypothetical protein